MLTKKEAYRPPAISICIEIKRSLRYPGIQLDTRLSFGDHMKKTAESASKTATALSQLLPNLGGLSQEKRVLLSLVISSRLLYVAPI